MKLLTLTLIALLTLNASSQEALQKNYDAILKELSADDFTVRSNAQTELEQLSLEHPKAAAKLLYRSYKDHPHPEIRQRSFGALRKLYKAKFTPPKRGYLGVRHDPDILKVDDNQINAVNILEVVQNSPASKAGLKNGDHITAVGDKDLTKTPIREISSAFSAAIKSHPAGSDVTITLYRGGKKIKLKATLGIYEDRFGITPDRQKEEFGLWLKSLEPKKK